MRRPWDRLSRANFSEVMRTRWRDPLWRALMAEVQALARARRKAQAAPLLAVVGPGGTDRAEHR